MPQTMVTVDSGIAEALTAQASRRGKTLKALADEILGSAVLALQEGGDPRDFHGAWQAWRMSKAIRGAALVPPEFISRLVEQIDPGARESILQACFDLGHFVGGRIRIYYPSIEQLHDGFRRNQPLFVERRVEVRRTADTGDGHALVQLRVQADPAPELTACVERFFAGLLSAYSFRATASRITEGVIEIDATYDSRFRPKDATETRVEAVRADVG